MIAVTGATGHIGGNLVRTLLARGERVRVLVHGGTRALDGLGAERVAGDVGDRGSLARLVAGADLVFHLAALISIDERDAPAMHAVNVEGARNVVDACMSAGVRRLVHFSSIHALAARPAEQPIDEGRGPAGGPGTPAYDLSKAAGEREVRAGIARGLDAVIVNPTAAIGPHDYGPSTLGEALVRIARGRLPCLVEGGFDWVDVRDVVAGALAAAERGRSGERYLLSGEWRSVRALAAMVAAQTGVPAPRLVAPMWMARLGAPLATGWARLTRGRPVYTHASLHALRNHRHVRHDKAARELGYAPRPLEQTVADFFAWLRSEGRVPSERAA
jgi:dihydroflavonol-4-reductase